MDQSGDNVDGQAPSTGSSLRWPPPGLERLQGDVWNIVRSGTLAVLILVFPLLSISLRQDFWSLGPLGRAWWIILITTGVGMGLVLETFVALFRLLRRASLGPLGRAWWIILITTGVGMGLVLETFVALFRLLRRASKAVERGYRWRTVAQVACDERRDTGFLLLGARWYVVFEEKQRSRVAGLRLMGAGLQLASILWLAAGGRIKGCVKREATYLCAEI